jgi:hypothetical protein
MALGGAGAAAQWKDCNVEIRLDGAVARSEDAKSDLTLEFQVRGGQVQTGFLRGRGLNQGRHVGTFKSASVQGGAIALDVEVDVKPDLWMKGGKGAYAVRLDLAPDGRTVSGTYQGTYNGLDTPKPGAAPRAGAALQPAEELPPELRAIILKTRQKTAAAAKVQAPPTFSLPVSGKVEGRILDPWPGVVAGHVPVAPGEHPRLIFRKADLPRLRQNAETPEGKAIMARCMAVLDYTAHDENYKFDSWPAIGYGFAWQMTGDAKYAGKARSIIQAKFFDRSPIGGQDIHHGPQLQGLALALDLCYDGWDDAFRQKCVDEIWHRTQECITGTAGGGTMGGLNMAYWSNHNGIRVAAAGLGALAVWHEKTRGGTVLEDEAVRVAEEAAYDARGWIRDGCGGGAWFMEGLFYKGMTLVRGLAPFLQAYPVATGRRIQAAPLGRHLIVGHFIEAAPGKTFVGGSPTGVLAGSDGIDEDSWAELVWTVGLALVPDDQMPAVKYLNTRSVGPRGDGTFGLARGCYAPYLMVAWPFGVQEKPPQECFDWLSPDPENGHWVFRPVWKDSSDILLTWNMLTHVRGSCHYERVGPALQWDLVGFGQKWLAGQFQPVVKGKEKVLAKDPVGARFLQWRQDGRIAHVSFDLGPAYTLLLERGRGDKTFADDLAKRAGGLRAVRFDDGLGERADMGIDAVRHVAVDCSGASGAPLLVAVLDEVRVRASADAAPAPAEIVWSLPLASKAVDAQGSAFRAARGDAVLAGVVLGGGPVSKTGSVEAPGGQVFAVLVLQKGPAPEFKVQGEGLAARVALGRRTVRIADGRLVLD